jgi:hypothetical protein
MVVKEQGVKVWTRFIWFKIATSVRLLRMVPYKGGNSFIR